MAIQVSVGSIKIKSPLTCNREFETFWNSIDNTISLPDLHSRCQGWIARYEIWSVAAKSAEKILESQVPLSPEEVWLAIHQSLRKEASKNWRFHFPLAISKNLQTIVVLQTLYTVSPPKSGGKVSVKSTNMHLEAVLGLKSTWWELQKQPPQHGSTVERGGPDDTGTYYTYKMTFHPDGHLIYFTDFHQLQQSTLAILQISDTGFATLVRKCEVSPDWDGDKVLFHTTHPIVFIYRDRVVYVWEYMDKPDLLAFYNPRCGYHDGLQEMSVSSCGKFLVMTFPGKPPIIQSIATYLGSDQKPESSKVVTFPSQKEVQVLSTGSHLSLLSTGQVLEKVETEINENGFHSSLGVHKSSASIEINQWTSNEAGTVEKQQRLTTLPRWLTMEDTRVAVRWPSEKDQMVKIVMNQCSKKHYSHATAQIAEAGPILIQRDTRTLQLPTGTRTVLESSEPPNKSKGTSKLSDI